jgi:hypothetical protein
MKIWWKLCENGKPTENVIVWFTIGKTHWGNLKTCDFYLWMKTRGNWSEIVSLWLKWIILEMTIFLWSRKWSCWNLIMKYLWDLHIRPQRGILFCVRISKWLLSGRILWESLRGELSTNDKKKFVVVVDSFDNTFGCTIMIRLTMTSFMDNPYS